MSQSGDGWFVEVTPDNLDVARFTGMVTAGNCGAVAAFVGTTRDHFDGRRVVRLEYEAYGPMALRKMQVSVCSCTLASHRIDLLLWRLPRRQRRRRRRDHRQAPPHTHTPPLPSPHQKPKTKKDVCERAREKFGLEKIAVSHRTGVVPVAEASVVLAASSAHRKAALDGVAWALDELKQTVPVWKREVFEDGSQWKANDGSRPHEGLGGAVAAAEAGGGAGA
jgi:molybdopterin synthase catalytic subunit